MAWLGWVRAGYDGVEWVSEVTLGVVSNSQPMMMSCLICRQALTSAIELSTLYGWWGGVGGLRESLKANNFDIMR